MFLFVWFLIPETKVSVVICVLLYLAKAFYGIVLIIYLSQGMALERMDDLFGVTELAEKVEHEMEHGQVDSKNSRDAVNGKAQHVEIAPVGSQSG